MLCRQCGNTVIPSTVVVSNLPQDGTMCDECNLKATTEPEMVIATIDAFTDHDQEAAMREEAMVIAGSEEEAGPAEPEPEDGTEPEFALDDGGGDDDGLSPDAYAGVQYTDIEASGAAFKENDRSVARAVFAKFQSASEELNLSSCLKGGMGGSAAGEITAGSIAAVLEKLDVDSRDIFIDLWSGSGAVVAVGSELRGINRVRKSASFLFSMVIKFGARQLGVSGRETLVESVRPLLLWRHLSSFGCATAFRTRIRRVNMSKSWRSL